MKARSWIDGRIPRLYPALLRSVGGKLLAVLAVIQVLAGVALGALSFISRLHKQGSSDLTRHGWWVFWVSALILAGATIAIQKRTASDADAAQRQLMRTIADAVMTKAPSTSTSPEPLSTGQALRIVAPADGTSVDAETDVRGHVADGSGAVWVIIHPLNTSSFWVQSRASSQRNGNWQTTGYFGRSGSLDAGRTFELLAVADPHLELTQGTILGEWPSGNLVSDIITVRRR